MTAHGRRDKARKLREIADRTVDPLAKAALLGLAADWAALADKADEELRRRLEEQ
jgi:hypothetical protein